jgi:hypothetical protein
MTAQPMTFSMTTQPITAKPNDHFNDPIAYSLITFPMTFLITLINNYHVRNI